MIVVAVVAAKALGVHAAVLDSGVTFALGLMLLVDAAGWLLMISICISLVACQDDSLVESARTLAEERGIVRKIFARALIFIWVIAVVAAGHPIFGVFFFCSWIGAFIIAKVVQEFAKKYLESRSSNAGGK
jgi:hypothetical protein